MPHLVKDYEASQSDIRLMSDGSAILLFLTEDGWIGIVLNGHNLTSFRDRMLAARLPQHGQRH